MDIESPPPPPILQPFGGVGARSRSSRLAEKKLRKRKELDAMIRNKPAQRKGGIYRRRHQLLRDDDCSEESSSSSSSADGFTRGGSGRGGKPQSNRRIGGRSCFHGTCVLSTLLASLAAIVTVIWLHLQMNITVDRFRSQLDSVVEERKFANDNHHRMHTTIQEIIANQSLLSNDITLLTNLYHNCSSHIHKLDSSLRTLMKTLDSAPELKTLPKDMEDAQKNLAKFGSALTNLESRVSGLETELTHNVAEMAQSLNKTLSKRNDEEFDSMIRVVVQERLQPLKEEIKQLDANRRIFASNITQQLKNQEVSFAQNLELMKQLEDEMRKSSRARPGKANFRGIIQSLRVEDENGGGGP